jgi:S-adenosyl-L-methionine hydrolase (adenosine-forming)
MLVLFTDFGGHDPYVGQVKAVLAQHAQNVPVIDLLHDAPAFNIKAGAHLLAALCKRFAPGSVFLAVVDPGVGGERNAALMEADGRYFVGPDNGLLSVVAARAVQRRFWRIAWKPQDLSDSFHGRDLFAPIAAWIARGTFPTPKLAPVPALDVDLGGDDLGEIIYLDHYGNAMTGLQAALLTRDARLVVAHRHVGFARMFSEVPKGAPFWYENCIGLVEIAVNCGSAGESLGLEVGQHVMAVMSG